MSATPAQLQRALDAALRELRQTLAVTKAQLARVRSEPTTTPEERRQLQAEARSGVLGRDMATIARHVESGETSWQEVFEGISPHTDLLRDHVDRMVALHRDDVRRALAADPVPDPVTDPVPGPLASHEEV